MSDEVTPAEDAETLEVTEVEVETDEAEAEDNAEPVDPVEEFKRELRM